MRNVKWLVAAVLVASTTGCVESVNQGYGYNSGYGYGYNNGYSSGYYPSGSGYYSQPARVNNYYYNPQPTVVTQTRYVPVPTRAPPRYVDRSNDHRWSGRDNHQPPASPGVDRPHGPPPPQANNGPPRGPGPGASGGNHRDRDRDRDGDGRPDRRG